MNKQDKQGLVPALRFPEFKNSSEWNKHKLENIAEFYKGKGISKADISPNGHQQCIRYGELYTIYGEVINDVISRTDLPSNDLFLSNAGDVIIPASGETKIDIATAACVVHEGIALGGDINIIRSSQNGFFLSYYLNGALKYEIAKVAQGDTVVHLYKHNLANLDLALPPLSTEQQKIADCLTSVDTLITNQNKKLEALKDHKKGLMQQLFPAEGETVPKLRFPEFKDNGHWKKEVLGKLGELVSGLTYSPDDVREQGLLVLRSSNVQNGQIALGDNVYVRTDIKGANISKANDILICVRNGSKALIGKNALIPEGLQHCTHGAFMTVFRAKNPKFVYQLFQTNCYERQVSADLGATINSINGKQFVRYEFLIPTDENEQTKIANFLFSVDDLIATQNKKIETLKVYKKGLMQQLFPYISEFA